MSLKEEITELYDRCILAGEVAESDAVNLLDNYWGDVKKNLEIQEMYKADPGLAAKGRCVSALIRYEIYLHTEMKARVEKTARIIKEARKPPTTENN